MSGTSGSKGSNVPATTSGSTGAPSVIGAAEHWTVIASPIGLLTLVATAAGLRNVWFDDETLPPLDAIERVDPVSHHVLDATAAQLAAYFAGAGGAFSLPLDLRGTPFQQRVWSALCAIPAGTTRTYGAIAADITAERAAGAGAGVGATAALVLRRSEPAAAPPRQPTSARAVAAAVGRTPVPIVVPCHRVIGGDGSLTGYRGGLERKRTLLRLEGVAITAADPAASPARARAWPDQLPLL